jgi:hypothetical protein
MFNSKFFKVMSLVLLLSPLAVAGMDIKRTSDNKAEFLLKLIRAELVRKLIDYNKIETLVLQDLLATFQTILGSYQNRQQGSLTANQNLQQFLVKNKEFLLEEVPTIIRKIEYVLNTRARHISSSTPTRPPAHNHQAEEQECLICLEDKDTRDFCTLSCGHKGWCKGCLKEQVDLALTEKSTVSLKCPNPECKKPMTEQDIRTITHNNRNKLTAYADITTKEWMLTQDNAKQCPTPNCHFVFINEDQNPQKIKCPQCTHEYCSHCLLPHSNRISCKEAEENQALGKNKTQAEKETDQWKKEHTKPCPYCKTTIEKTNGCNAVLCTQCNHEFCFKCREKFDHYNWNDPRHKCMLWDQDAAAQAAGHFQQGQNFIPPFNPFVLQPGQEFNVHINGIPVQQHNNMNGNGGQIHNHANPQPQPLNWGQAPQPNNNMNQHFNRFDNGWQIHNHANPQPQPLNWRQAPQPNNTQALQDLKRLVIGLLARHANAQPQPFNWGQAPQPNNMNAFNEPHVQVNHDWNNIEQLAQEDENFDIEHLDEEIIRRQQQAVFDQIQRERANNRH